MPPARWGARDGREYQARRELPKWTVPWAPAALRLDPLLSEA
jgi:hypothetical protein